MAIGKDGAVLRQLRTLFNVGTVRDLTDGQLLERFATDRDDSAELAFAILVERHGPMVLRVCRSVLNNSHDTQDAFQATFLVLVRKARALWVRDSLGPWLHQVAYRTASCVRLTTARRRRHEQQAAIAVEEARAEPIDDLAGVLHEEIDRLPERYRAPVVLCDLEGCTHEQAARNLGWPVGTVKSRLSRARERLRNRLLRRGVTPDVSLIASAISPDSSWASIPTGLMDSTAGAATRFLTVQTMVRGSAASISQGVLRSMSITRWLKAASVLLVAGATIAGADVLAQRGTSGTQTRPEEKSRTVRVDDVPAFEVKPGNLIVNVIERGSLEAGRVSNMYCEVEGDSTIVRIVPEGMQVKKGQLVCLLDASKLKSQLIPQTTARKRAEAAYQNARLVREIAEIAVKEYEQVISKQEGDALKEEIILVQAAIHRAKDRLERTRRARKRLDEALAAMKGPRMTVDIMADLDIDDRLEATQHTIESEERALGRARAGQELLEKFTREKTSKELVVDLERKRIDELTKQEAWELEKRNESRLRQKIENSSIYAPRDGVVEHANDPVVRAGRPRLQIEEGATIRERQIIGRIIDLSGPMLVNAKVHESQIDRIQPGQRAKIRVDAFPEEELTGVVESSAPLPDPTVFFNQAIKVYTTMLRIDKGPASLRPGMTAQVDILIHKLENVLSVPVPAVLVYDGKDHVAVKKPGGGFEWREVVLGIANAKDVEIKEGIRSGEAVILNPIALMSEEEKRTKFSTPTKPAIAKPTAKGKGRLRTAPRAKTQP